VATPAEVEGALVASIEGLFGQLAGPGRYDYKIQKALFSQYLDQLINLLNRRPLTQLEIERYILTDDPVSAPGKKLLVTMGAQWNCPGKVVQLLSKLVARGHFGTVGRIVLEYRFSNGEPLWGDLIYEDNFRAEVVNKVPPELYQRFKNAPPHITRQDRSPEEMERMMIGDAFWVEDPDHLEYIERVHRLVD
jgi:hypothetical protein